MNGHLTPRDSFQIQAFQAMFKAYQLQGLSNICALGMAVAATSDETVNEMIKANPNLIRDWKRANKKEKKC
jgi:hypothetical protein